MDDRDGEAALVARAKAGNREAAEALARGHWRSCWSVARGITGDPALAEDVVQESLLAALRSLHGFDPALGSFRAWLHRITVNRSLNAVRRRRAHVSLGEAAELPAPAEPEPEGPAFLAAVAAATPGHRAVLVLRYGLDYSPNEIAEVLGVPLGTVHSRLARALDALRTTMEARNGG